MKKLTFISMLFLASSIFAQSDDLKIFGYFQNNFSYISTNDTEFWGQKARGWDTKSFVLQQMNLFAAKNFGTEFSSFVNLEFTNSFSMEDNVGYFRIEEAWLKYSPSSGFNFKSGLLIPRFNNFNEIKNRTVLLPYIYRPMVYETAFSQQFNTAEFVPLQAYLQVYGDILLNKDIRMNYAAFMGNSSSDNLIKNSAGIAIANDSSRSKLFGGRLGFEYGALAFGGSISYDKKKAFDSWDMNLGYIPRIRTGAYLNFSIEGFEIEAEYIKVSHKLNQEQKDTIAVNMLLFPKFTFDKEYLHTNVLYNITDKIYAYVGFDKMKTQDNVYSMGGLDQWTVGGGYRINEAIVVKGQYVNQKSKLYDMLPITRQDYLLGASVYF